MDAYYYYTANQEHIVQGHLGEFVVIQGDRILGYYKTRFEGLNAMADREIPPGTYIVHKCRQAGELDIEITGIQVMENPVWKHQQ